MTALVRVVLAMFCSQIRSQQGKQTIRKGGLPLPRGRDGSCRHDRGELETPQRIYGPRAEVPRCCQLS